MVAIILEALLSAEAEDVINERLITRAAQRTTSSYQFPVILWS